MKNIRVLLFFSGLILSCDRAENTSVVPVNEISAASGVLKTTGVFMDGDGENALNFTLKTRILKYSTNFICFIKNTIRQKSKIYKNFQKSRNKDTKPFVN